jgi:hypothetical protein
MMNRSHRNRKVRYIKALEAEVQRAAHHETKRAREVETLRERIQQLTGLLTQYGIPTPSHSPDGTPGEAGRSISLAFVQSAFPNVYPACPGKPRGPAAVASPGGGIGHEIVDTTPHPVLLMDSTWTHTYPEDHVEALTNQSLLLGTSEKATGAQCDSGRLQGSDLAAVAMDFVLTYVVSSGKGMSINHTLITNQPIQQDRKAVSGALTRGPNQAARPNGTRPDGLGTITLCLFWACLHGGPGNRRPPLIPRHSGGYPQSLARPRAGCLSRGRGHTCAGVALRSEPAVLCGG